MFFPGQDFEAVVAKVSQLGAKVLCHGCEQCHPDPLSSSVSWGSWLG